MADNVTVGGVNYSTDDVTNLNGGVISAGTAQTQRMKMQYGDDGTARDVSAAFPLPVTNTPATPTGFGLSSAATTNATSVKGSAGTIYAITASNVGAAAAFVKIYNKATAPTVGTDVPAITLPIAAASVTSINLGQLGQRFSTGIALAFTNLGADTDTTAVAAAQVKVMISYI